MRGTAVQAPGSVKKGRGCASDAGAEIALQPVVKPMVLKDCTLWKGPTPGQGESVRATPKGMSSRDTVS